MKALLEEAEAEAAEAEALAAAARARARAARLRREALAEAAEAKEQAADAEAPADAGERTDAAETTQAAETTLAAETTETTEAEEPPSDVDDTVEDSGAESDAEAPVAAAGQRSRLATLRRRLPSPSTALKCVAIVLICVFAGVTGYMAWQDHEAADRTNRAANFVAGARQGIVNMTSLDFKRAKEDVQRVLDSSTGQFRDDFQQRAKDFTTVVEQSKVTTQGTVNAAALESMNGNSASVLVLATSKITNAAGAKDEPRVFRLRVTVTEDGGQYKMSKVDFVA